MARIPVAELERLKAEVAVERLAEARGIVLARRGADLVGLCPFHEDHEPSLVITPAKNLWHCLGACQAGGSAIDWVMRAEGVSFRHAVELLLADYQPSAMATGAVKRSTVPKLPTALARDAEDARLFLQVIAYYHDTLKQSPEALAYLEKRGVASSEAISRFQLGFANRTLGYRLPAKNRQEGAAIRGQLQRIGVLRPSGHEHFNGSLVIPVFGEKGEVAEVYGRKVTDHLREGTPVHLYLPGPHRGVWNVEALAADKEIILCESLIDALSFWCAGYRNVTASYGVEGFTPDHLAAFKTHGTERVLIAYDRDAAGEAAAEKLACRNDGCREQRGDQRWDAIRTTRVRRPMGSWSRRVARRRAGRWVRSVCADAGQLVACWASRPHWRDPCKQWHSHHRLHWAWTKPGDRGWSIASRSPAASDSRCPKEPEDDQGGDRRSRTPIPDFHREQREGNRQSPDWKNRLYEPSWKSRCTVTMDCLKIYLSDEELKFLRQAPFLPAGAMNALINVERTSGGRHRVEIYRDVAEQLRAVLTERLAQVGFGADYEPNVEGRILEALIDRFFSEG